MKTRAGRWEKRDALWWNNIAISWCRCIPTKSAAMLPSTAFKVASTKHMWVTLQKIQVSKQTSPVWKAFTRIDLKTGFSDTHQQPPSSPISPMTILPLSLRQPLLSPLQSSVNSHFSQASLIISHAAPYQMLYWTPDRLDLPNFPCLENQLSYQRKMSAQSGTNCLW